VTADFLSALEDRLLIMRKVADIDNKSKPTENEGPIVSLMKDIQLMSRDTEMPPFVVISVD
jgi:hypothetical protein